MNINVQYYIGGDAPKVGFNVIGRSDNFHEDAGARWINHGSEVEDRTRVEPADYKQPDRLIKLCHVWEYQTDSFGVPAFISSYAGISNHGRFHGFAEYIMPELDQPVSQIATAGQMIDAATRLNTLDFYEFWEIESTPIPPRDYVLDIRDVLPAAWIKNEDFDETWLLTLVSRYWESASKRAFSQGSFNPVLVCLGQIAEEKQEDIDCTIETTRKFYATAIAPKLPAQVQNITSFAAGVDCRDAIDRLNSALLFCIDENLNVEDALQLDEPKTLGQYKLCPAEMNFIRDVASGKTPTLVAEVMKQYQALHPDANLDVHQIPFMADYQVWYKLYCVEHLIQEGPEFLQQANLDIEENEEDKIRIRPARSYFLLMNDLRSVFLDHDKEVKKAEIDALLKGCEEKLLQMMLESMQTQDAKSFIVRPSEMRMWHTKMLTTPYEELSSLMMQLLTMDQKLRAEKLSFTRALSSTRVSETTDERNAALMKSLLENCIRPLIEHERGKEKIAEESPLRTLGNAEFVNWACAYPKTRRVFHDFFADVVKDAELHFLLYGIGITDGYLTFAELACNTLRIFTEKYSMPGTLPPLKSRVCAVLNDAAYFDNRPSEGVAEAFTEFCIACSHHYGEKMDALKPFFTDQKAFPVVRGRAERTDQNNLSRYSTAPALIAIFKEQEEAAEPMIPERAHALWETLSGGCKGAERSQVANAFAHMLGIRRDRMLQEGKSPVQWLGQMMDAVSFELNTTGSLVAVFDACTASVGSGEDGRWQIDPHEAEEAFEILGGEENRFAKQDKVKEAYAGLLKTQRDDLLRKNRSPIAWLKAMKDAAPFQLDTTDSMVAFLNTATDTIGKVPEDQWLINEDEVKEAFESLCGEDVKNAQNAEVINAYAKLLSTKRDDLLQAGKSPVEWMKKMLEAAPFEASAIDTTDSLIEIFNAAAHEAEKGDNAAWQIDNHEAAEAFAVLGGEEGRFAKDAKVVEAYGKLLSAQRDAMLHKGEAPVDKLQSMAKAAPFALDLTDSLVTILRDYTSHAGDTDAVVPSVTDISSMFEVMYEPSQAASKNEPIKAALLEMVNAYREVLLKQGTIPTHWLNDIWKVASEAGLAFDTSDSVAAIFKHSAAHARMDVGEASDIFDILGEHANAMEEKVRPAFTGMVSAQLKAGLEGEDESIIDWVCGMARLGGQHFTGRFNTSEWLTTIFKLSGSDDHPWLDADDAKACFQAMGNYASDLKGTVRNAYKAMLDRRIQDAAEYDEDCFLWLDGMTCGEGIPYAQDKDWLTDMHGQMIRLLTDRDDQDKEKLRIMTSWLENGTVSRSGKTALQGWCNNALEEEQTEPADALCSKFEMIDARFELLRKYVHQQYAKAFKKGLHGMDKSAYSNHLICYARKMESVGSNLNQLYDECTAETDAFMKKAFEHASYTSTFVAIGKQIPNSTFKTAWQERLNQLFGCLQEGLFNDCRSLSDMQELRKEVEENGGLNRQLKYAYELLDQYDGLLKQLTKDNEVQVLEDVGKVIHGKVLPWVILAESARENLCRRLKEQKYDAVEELEKLSFRHAVAAWLMQAALSENMWEAVLSSAVTDEALKKATQKPYAKENLKVLQRLLALVDAVSCANRFAPDRDWRKSLIQTLGKISTWKEYQLALSRNRKQGMLYGLSFDHNGMLDFGEEESTF